MPHAMPHRNTNESKPYRILHATKWSKGGGCELRTRLIVIEFPTAKDDFGKYAVRWQSFDGATFGGGSFNSKKSAHDAFLRRYLDHNASYKAGNVSHLPGIVK